MRDEMTKRIFLTIILLLVLISTGISETIKDTSACYWVSQPVKTSEAVYLQGYKLDSKAQIEIACLNNTDPGKPTSSCDYSSLDFRPADSKNAAGQSVVFILPESDQQYASYAVRILRGNVSSEVKIVNSPQIWWCQGTLGSASTEAGGRITVNGSCLNFADNARAVLKAEAGDYKKLQFVKGSAYSVEFKVGKDVENGEYDLYLHNGLGGGFNWSKQVKINIASSPFSCDKVYDIRDYVPTGKKDFGRSGEPFSIYYDKMVHVDPDNDKIFAEAIKDVAQKGGGIISIPMGHFFLSKTLELPPNVRLRGSGRDMTVLNWSDHEKRLYGLITGTVNFGVEDMTLWVGNHLNGIATKGKRLEDRGNAYFRRLNIRMTPLSPKTKRRFTLEQMKESYNDRLWIGDNQGRGERNAAFRLSGKNIEITDCIVMTNPAVWEACGIFLERVKGAYVKGNEVLSSFRAAIYINGVEDLVFMDNDVTGGTFIGTHHTTVSPEDDFPPYDPGDGSFVIEPFYHKKAKKNYYLNTTAKNMYFAGNTYRYSLVCDSEVMTTDSHFPLGIYYGKIDRVEGRTTWLAEETEHPDKFGERWPDLNYWKGAGLYILDGKGAGQYRTLQYGSKGKKIKLDQAWEVEPDETSVVSIAKFHGRLIYEDNQYRDCGVFQFWGGGIENIVDSNRFVRNAGAHSYAGQVYNGIMPDWYNEFIDNEFFSSDFMGTQTYDYTEEGVLYGKSVKAEPEKDAADSKEAYGAATARFKDEAFWYTRPVYKGPISRGLIHRDNVHHTGKLMIKGGVDGAVVENNTAVEISTHLKAGLAEPENIFERDNHENK
jgi:hypothetical protein